MIEFVGCWEALETHSISCEDYGEICRIRIAVITQRFVLPDALCTNCSVIWHGQASPFLVVTEAPRPLQKDLVSSFCLLWRLQEKQSNCQMPRAAKARSTQLVTSELHHRTVIALHVGDKRLLLVQHGRIVAAARATALAVLVLVDVETPQDLLAAGVEV